MEREKMLDYTIAYVKGLTYLAAGAVALFTLFRRPHKEVYFNIDDYKGKYEEAILNLDWSHIGYFISGNFYRNEMDYVGKGDTVHIEDLVGERVAGSKISRSDIPETVTYSDGVRKLVLEKKEILTEDEQKKNPWEIDVVIEQHKEGFGIQKGIFLDVTENYNRFRNEAVGYHPKTISKR